MVRITAGKYKGIKLEVPASLTRPTKDMVKEALFSFLSNIYNKSFLDLFAGSGAIGLEAYSRGSEDVTLIDNSEEAITVIKNNIAKLQAPVNFFKEEGEVYLKKCNRSFDIIFMDPPYFYEKKDLLFSLVKEYKLLNKDGLLIYEQDIKEEIKQYEGFKLIKEKKYGKTYLCTYKEEI